MHRKIKLSISKIFAILRFFFDHEIILSRGHSINFVNHRRHPTFFNSNHFGIQNIWNHAQFHHFKSLLCPKKIGKIPKDLEKLIKDMKSFPNHFASIPSHFASFPNNFASIQSHFASFSNHFASIQTSKSFLSFSNHFTSFLMTYQSLYQSF